MLSPRIFFKIYPMIIFALLVVTVLLPPSILVYPFKQRTRDKIVPLFWNIFSHLFLRYGLLCSYKVFDRSNGQNKSEASLIIANHQSAADIPLVCTHYAISPLMKSEVLRMPVFGFVAKVAGAISVDRGDIRSKRKAFIAIRKRMEDNFSFLFYPEGTRTINGIPRPFTQIKTPLIKEAFKQNHPILPLSLHGTKDIFDDKYILQPNKQIGMIAHQLLYPKDFSDADAFAAAAWEKVISGNMQLRGEI